MVDFGCDFGVHWILKRVLKSTTFEESQKRIDDLRSLVREYEAPVNYKEELGTKFNIDTFTLPYDYLYLVSTLSRAHINDNCTPVAYNLEEADPIQYFVVPFFVLFNLS